MFAVFIAVPVFFETPSHGQKSSIDYFDEAWTLFDQNYSYFTYKGIDWDLVKTTYRDKFTEDMTAGDFAENFSDMLTILHDWHVWVRSPAGDYLGYYEAYKTNYPETLSTRYTGGSSYETMGKNVIYHALLDGNIAHVVIDSLAASSFDDIEDDDITTLFTRYADAEGMIVDIRANNGGKESNALKIASRFTDKEILYGYVKYRVSGTNHDAFGNLISKKLIPDENMFYDKPVVCLIGRRCMSSAEWFALMMKKCPGVTLIGDTTRGASANPKTFELDNGVQLSVSSWFAYTDGMEPIEDKGIEPDIWIDPDASYDDERDYVLEKAMAVIQEQETSDCLSFNSDLSIEVPCMSIGEGRFRVVFQYTGNGFAWEVADYRTVSTGVGCIPFNNDLTFKFPCIELEGMNFELDFEYTGTGLIWDIVF